MSEVIAHLTELPACIFHITAPSLGIEYSHKHPSFGLCRLIVEKHPDLADASLKVYSGEDHRFTIRNIGDWAKKTIVERDKGSLNIVPFVPKPLSAFQR